MLMPTQKSQGHKYLQSDSKQSLVKIETEMASNYCHSEPTSILEMIKQNMQQEEHYGFNLK
jgi:hypothetical protein